MPDLPNSATLLRASVCMYDGDEGATGSAMTALVVELLVDLDLSTLDGFRRSFGTLLEEATRDGPTNCSLIVLDLSHVDFMSIEGASALVEAKDQVAGFDLEFRLVTATRGVDRALAATGARPMFECHAAVQSALESGSRFRTPRRSVAPVNGHPDDRRHRRRTV